MAEKWIEVHQTKELRKGDIVELDFLLMSLFDWDVWYGVQITAIEERFDKDPRFSLLSTTHPQNGQVTFKVRVDQNPVTVATIIALILIGVSIFVTFIVARRLVQAVAGTAVGTQQVIRETGWTAMKIALALVIGLVAWKSLKAT